MTGDAPTHDDPSDEDRTELSVSDAIHARRSVRRFRDEPVSSDDLETILESARLAPSSYNLQPWRVVVVRSAEARARLADACFQQPPVVEAPMCLVFASDPSSWRDQIEEILRESVPASVDDDAAEEWVREQSNYIGGFQKFLERSSALREYAIKDTMIAAAHAVLTATSLGLSTCYMNGWTEPKVVEAIGGSPDDGLAIAVVIAIGHGAEEPGPSMRLPMDRVVFDDRLSDGWRG